MNASDNGELTHEVDKIIVTKTDFTVSNKANCVKEFRIFGDTANTHFEKDYSPDWHGCPHSLRLSQDALDDTADAWNVTKLKQYSNLMLGWQANELSIMYYYQQKTIWGKVGFTKNILELQSEFKHLFDDDAQPTVFLCLKYPKCDNANTNIMAIARTPVKFGHKVLQVPLATVWKRCAKLMKIGQIDIVYNRSTHVCQWCKPWSFVQIMNAVTGKYTQKDNGGKHIGNKHVRVFDYAKFCFLHIVAK